ncbi:MAG: aminoacyl-tRNA hydrolase [Chloroherpetonaceae bacterium]|nr:aminoacyl-tRNA hydrolase [Chloroherpetonaceae bacterium]MCS7211260.1 aminoacyl-tRNA hydrolase [Chloroherpetonaceae bacterium]MDW8019680.1 aminoacyl-tRNA hydrolase [Chloroherpetonaceae bacterium]MDW8465243.1 aminoacyl-tRNA hydrolase [Chloroherpetonaceae bacterium]
MKLIVGLGNPEPRYDGTRHNIGFAILDALAQELGVAFQSGKGDYLLAKAHYAGIDVLLQKPLTYMNLSGRAVRQAMQFYKVSVSDVLVVCDDLNLPLGAVRLRPKGSAGGQNGLRNIITELGREDFARLRFGIGNPPHKGAAANYVLSPFRADELPIVQEAIAHCVKACLCFVEHGIQLAMTRFNRKEPASL